MIQILQFGKLFLYLCQNVCQILAGFSNLSQKKMIKEKISTEWVHENGRLRVAHHQKHLAQPYFANWGVFYIDVD